MGPIPLPYTIYVHKRVHPLRQGVYPLVLIVRRASLSKAKYLNERMCLMSVLKAHRSESRAEYVNTANKIYVQTINFLSRLSSRYSRLVAESVAELASEVVDNAEKANSIYPSDETRKELRKQHLLESRAALMALDVHLAHCYDLMMLNPAGCFTKSNGDNVGSSDAKKKLEHMSQELGELIDAENTMLTNVLKSDKGR